MPTIENPVQFLRDNGLLFELNRQVLHPLGMELDIRLDEDGKITGIDLVDNRDNPQPLSFGPAEFTAGREKYNAYLDERGRRNIQKRRQMGMVIQTGPQNPYTPAGGAEGEGA